MRFPKTAAKPSSSRKCWDIPTRKPPKLLAFALARFALAFIIHDGDEISVHVFYNARLWSDDHIASIVCSTQLHTGTNIRCLGTNQWNSLLLHVRTHQCTVSIVVLQERNHGGTNRDHLTR